MLREVHDHFQDLFSQVKSHRYNCIILYLIFCLFAFLLIIIVFAQLGAHLYIFHVQYFHSVGYGLRSCTCCVSNYLCEMQIVCMCVVYAELVHLTVPIKFL